MKKKGFTLIELLAVIVVLAIIALIATPIVMNIIENVRKNAFKSSVNNIIKSGELYFSEKLLSGQTVNKTTIFEFPNNIEELQVEGVLPTEGSMMISSEGAIALAVSNGEYCITKKYTDSELEISEDLTTRVIPKVTNGIMSSNDYCIKSGICGSGTLVNVQVNESKAYDFYVINDKGDELTLILNQNLGTTLPWISETDYTTAGGTNYGIYGSPKKGPITLLDTLAAVTFDWDNITEKTYIVSDDGGANKYQPIKITSKARLITFEEITNLGCTSESGSCPSYLYNPVSSVQHLGYWTSAASASNYARAIFICTVHGHYSAHNIASGSQDRVRPVITIPKSTNN